MPQAEPSDSTQRLAGKVAVLAGAGSELGRAIAFAFAFQGTRVVVRADVLSNGGHRVRY